MRQAFPLVILGAALSLAGCGGGGVGFGGGAESVHSRVSPAYAVEPTLPDTSDEIDDSMTSGNGASGVGVQWDFLGGSAKFVPLKLTLNADRSVLTLEIDNVTYVLNSTEPPGVLGGPTQIGGQYGIKLSDVGFGSTTPSVGTQHSFNTGLFSFVKQNGTTSFTYAEGIYGIETPSDRLPASASYAGSLDLTAIISSPTTPAVSGFFGDFDMDIDYNNGAITGGTDGQLLVNGPGGLVPVDVIGDLSGSFADGGIAATSTLADGGTSLMDVSLSGRVYGWDAQAIGGSAIGIYLPSGDLMVGVFEDGP